MEDMWLFRDRPVPLDFDLIQSNQFVLRGQASGVVDYPTDGTSRHANGGKDVEVRPSGRTPNSNGNNTAAIVNNTTVRPGHGLKDQRPLSLRENLVLFVSRLVSCISFTATMRLHCCCLQYRAPRRTSHNGQ
jgi:ubiquitin-like 1-activating enzyme E1 B